MGHRISIYKDKKEIIIIVPVPRHINGYGWQIDKPAIIKNPSDVSFVGKKARESFEMAAKETPFHGEKGFDYEQVTGTKNYAKFTRERKNVWGYMDIDKGYYIFRPSKRERGGGYTPINKAREKEYTLSIDSTDEEIGRMIMKAFEDCLL
ncbi:contact-dependent growth inhibition system immunity protein [Pelotomaculum propionicicum]|uniref:contact-dependent growth inhibition system immunity protein n=1 Tax=Pelotomaculum propionicicum TaxID=258475 RepID=UPI003B7EE089